MDELLLRRDEATLNRVRLAEEFLDPRTAAPPPVRPPRACLGAAMGVQLLTDHTQMTTMCGATGQTSS